MITPSEIRDKGLRLWQSDAFWMSVIDRGADFPQIDIPFGKLKSKDMRSDFVTASAQVSLLRSESKESKGYGYSIEFVKSNHRQLGIQNVPGRIYFETSNDFLRYIGKKKDFETFLRIATETLNHQPILRIWMKKNPLRVIENSSVWYKLMIVCKYFQEHPAPGLYLRQLDIPGVDTKFIENNKALLRDILDEVLPVSSVNRGATGLSGHGFERRYFLLHEEPAVRFRILDRKHAFLSIATDITLPAAQFNALDFPCSRVFFTENKTNSLCFPDVDDSIVIFGGGYGISVLKEAAWLRNKEIFYWGDIDTHGFSILSQLRGYFPHVHSILMDAHTLHTFKSQWGEEDEDKRCLIELTYLTYDEWQLYSDLRDNIPGERIRLEQEKISFGYLCKILQNIQIQLSS